MTQNVAMQRVVYTLHGMSAVIIEPELAYGNADTGPMSMDLYYPAGMPTDTRRPAVIFVTGFSDLGAEKMLGRRFKDMGSFSSWA